jgi:hypothetical protein
MTKPQKNRSIAVICLIAFMVVGCATLLGPRFETAQGKYLGALRFFDDTVESYLVYFRQATPEVQEQWRKEIDPYMTQASDALDLWGLALAAGESTVEKQKAYLKIKDTFLALLLQYEIIKVTDK